jgi:hypothetical protein
MAVFIHLFDARNKDSICRNGIKPSRGRENSLSGVFATPQLENHEITHQWMRELKRYDSRVTLAARFRISDSEQVFIGRYNEKHLDVSASKAHAIMKNHTNGLGLEVIIPRTIRPLEIIKIYKPLKVIGWRYHPSAHGTKPCGCEYCQLGQPYSSRIRKLYEEEMRDHAREDT